MQPERSCRKCGGEMKPSKAYRETYLMGLPDFPGDTYGRGQTISGGGPGVLVDCLKCSACGWSVTAQPLTWQLAEGNGDATRPAHD
jgi:hypothetical protein